MARGKQAGPLLTSITRGEFDALPPELRASLTVTTTVQKVNLDETPASLTGTLLESDVEQPDNTNERKETQISVSGLPVTLTGKGYTTEFGGGATTITKVFAYGSSTTPVGSLKLLKWEVNPLFNGISEEIKEELTASSWPVLHGQDFDKSTGAVVPFTRQVIAEGASLGTANAAIQTRDEKRSEITIYDYSSATLALTGNGTVLNKGVYYAIPHLMDIRFPNTLVGLSIVYNESKGNGEHLETGEGNSGGDSGSLSLSFQGRGQGAVALTPAIIPDVKDGFWENVEVSEYVWYMELNPSMAQVIARLKLLSGNGTVLPWPRFNPQGVTLVLRGQNVDLAANASAQQHVSISPSNTTYTRGRGSGSSRSSGLTTRTERLDPTIHGTITFANNYKAATAIASATASIAGSGAIWLNEGASVSNSGTAEASIVTTGGPTDNVIPATAGVTAIPTSGFYFRDLSMDPIPDLGVVKCRAILCDFSQFA